jgi:hypothetical protein
MKGWGRAGPGSTGFQPVGAPPPETCKIGKANPMRLGRTISVTLVVLLLVGLFAVLGVLRSDFFWRWAGGKAVALVQEQPPGGLQVGKFQGISLTGSFSKTSPWLPLTRKSCFEPGAWRSACLCGPCWNSNRCSAELPSTNPAWPSGKTRTAAGILPTSCDPPAPPPPAPKNPAAAGVPPCREVL